MSTSAETGTPARKGIPVYTRRRRRIYGAAALVLAVIVGVVVWATTGGSSGPAGLPGFTISVSQGSVASPDSIIESQASLAQLIPAKLHYVPFEAAKIDVHRRIAGAREPGELRALRDELRDRFGPLPEPVANLLELQRAAAARGSAPA